MATPRLEGRNGSIWRDTLNGLTQEAIAAKYNISQQQVSTVLRTIAASIPEEERQHLIARERDFLDALRVRAMELVDAPPIPAYSQGRPILMADGETVAEDHSGRVAAMKLAIQLHEKVANLTGLNAPKQITTTVHVAAQAEAAQAAAEAVGYLHDDGPDD